jgi:RNAse (barnase) inhibitor barstar
MRIIDGRKIAASLLALLFMMFSAPLFMGVAYAETREEIIDFYNTVKNVFGTVDRFESVGCRRRCELTFSGDTNKLDDTGAAIVPAVVSVSGNAESHTADVDSVVVGGTAIVPMASAAPPLHEIVTSETIRDVRRLTGFKTVKYMQRKRLIMTAHTRFNILMALEINYYHIVVNSSSKTQATNRMDEVILNIISAEEEVMPTNDEDVTAFYFTIKNIFGTVERFEPVSFMMKYRLKSSGETNKLGDTGAIIVPAVVMAPSGGSPAPGNTAPRTAAVDSIVIGSAAIIPMAGAAPPIHEIVTRRTIRDIIWLTSFKTVKYMQEKRLMMTDQVRLNIRMALEINYYHIVVNSSSKAQAMDRMDEVILSIIRAKEDVMPKY